MACFMAVRNPEQAQMMVDQLVASHIPLTVRGPFGYTFLHHAAANPFMEASATLIRALCANGACCDAIDDFGDQPLHIALRLDSYAAARMDNKASYERVIAGEAAPPHVQALLDCGAPVTTYGMDGWQPIHLAVRHQSRRGTMRGTLTALLAAGASARAFGRNPRTLEASWPAIHVAAHQNGHARGAEEAIRILVAAGESPSAPSSSQGIQPLHMVYGEPPCLPPQLPLSCMHICHIGPSCSLQGLLRPMPASSLLHVTRCPLVWPTISYS